MMESQDILRLLEAAFPDSRLELQDLRGDKEHYALYIESSSFANKSRLDQHRMVFDALEGRVGGLIRGLTLVTALPQDKKVEDHE